MKVNFACCRRSILVFAVLSSILSLSLLGDRTLANSNLLANESINNSEGDRDLTCPSNVEELTPLLLKNLPSYSNRVIQRTQDRNQAAGIENYIITASKAEFEPLDLPRLQYSQIDNQDPEQIFFTVLERQYSEGEVVEIQTYHWLFLANTDSGWRMVMLFSRFGNSRDNIPPTPPRETTNGIIGRGVQLWLRDCRGGTVRSEAISIELRVTILSNLSASSRLGANYLFLTQQVNHLVLARAAFNFAIAIFKNRSKELYLSA